MHSSKPFLHSKPPDSTCRPVTEGGAVDALDLAARDWDQLVMMWVLCLMLDLMAEPICFLI